MAEKSCCSRGGPGYASPLEAMLEGPREKIMYVTCVHTDPHKPDVLSTVDVDPESPTYCKIIHKLRMREVGDELHHIGWNICSSCYGSPRKRNVLVLPCLVSNRIYFVDTSNERAPTIKKVLEPSELERLNLSTPHTAHCAPTGEIIISTMGTSNNEGQGDFLCVDSETLEVKRSWTNGEKKAAFGYDFWYQPYHDTLVASEWTAPIELQKKMNFDNALNTNIYGRSLNIYSWSERKLKQVLELGERGTTPLEIRFLHDPKAAEGYVGCAIGSAIFRFFKTNEGNWDAEKVIDVPIKKVTGWVASEMPGMISNILLSLDDKYLYFSNWFQGDIRQYDITDRRKPKLTGQVFLGGSLLSDSNVRIVEGENFEKQPDPVYVKGRKLDGSPQMLQLSLDGRRLYVTTSIYKPYDKEIYPEHFKKGSLMLKLDIDTENGGMKLDESFLVEFGIDKDDILLAHEMRYPGGDCSSDIWLAK